MKENCVGLYFLIQSQLGDGWVSSFSSKDYCRRWKHPIIAVGGMWVFLNFWDWQVLENVSCSQQEATKQQKFDHHRLLSSSRSGQCWATLPFGKLRKTSIRKVKHFKTKKNSQKPTKKTTQRDPDVFQEAELLRCLGTGLEAQEDAGPAMPEEVWSVGLSVGTGEVVTYQCYAQG